MTKKIFQVKKVAVGLSGGVDSSVVCALLKKQGFEVVGVHLMLFNNNQEAQKRAKKVAQKLSISFLVFDLRKEFKKIVIDYFIDSYKKGITPNPCVVCNKKIKFGLLLQKAKEMGCDYLATGHYVRKLKMKNEKLKILRAENLEKDQTYFLWQLKQNQLKRVLFPLGEIESKEKVREMAKGFGLPTYKTPESNDVCFLTQTNLQDFLRNSCPKGRPMGIGKIIDIKGNVLGEHKGLWFYTIGQRKGIEIPIKKGRAALPWFVVKKNIKKNVLIVSQNEKDLLKKEVKFKNSNWISQPIKFPFKAKAKIRYGAQLASCLVYKDKAIFTKPQRAITPGQSVVFYGKGNELLGGGIIQ